MRACQGLLIGAALMLMGHGGQSAALDEGVGGRSFPFSEEYRPGDRFMNVRLLGAVELPPARIDGIDLAELSDLAWDGDENILYAVSDRGSIFHLRPVMTAGGILEDVRILRAFALRDSRRQPLRGSAGDAEGLAIAGGINGMAGDTRLLISFERQPRVIEFRPDGSYVQRHRLPDSLQRTGYYASGNKALEAITVHPKLGILTAPEWPPAGANPAIIPIHSLLERRIPYPRRPEPASALVAMEALADGSVITLERSFQSLLAPLVITLRRTEALPVATRDQPLSVTDMAIFDSTSGWRVDNFEGLTRHRGQRFFLVSDDNGQGFQKTILLYLELLANSADPKESPVF